MQNQSGEVRQTLKQRTEAQTDTREFKNKARSEKKQLKQGKKKNVFILHDKCVSLFNATIKVNDLQCGRFR